MKHKYYVAKSCIKRGMFIHAITHDWSKFSKHEFTQYAMFFSKETEHTLLINDAFDKAWQHHKDHNKHHWNYWHERKLHMPMKYVTQMICDWEAMSTVFNNDVYDWYNAHKSKMTFMNDYEVRLHIESLIGK